MQPVKTQQPVDPRTESFILDLKKDLPNMNEEIVRKDIQEK